MKKGKATKPVDILYRQLDDNDGSDSSKNVEVGKVS